MEKNVFLSPKFKKNGRNHCQFEKEFQIIVGKDNIYSIFFLVYHCIYYLLILLKMVAIILDVKQPKQFYNASSSEKDFHFHPYIFKILQILICTCIWWSKFETICEFRTNDFLWHTGIRGVDIHFILGHYIRTTPRHFKRGL